MLDLDKKAEFLNLVALKILNKFDYSQFIITSYFTETELDEQMIFYKNNGDDEEIKILKEFELAMNIKDENYRNILLSRFYDSCINSLVAYSDSEYWLKNKSENRSNNSSLINSLFIFSNEKREDYSNKFRDNEFEILALNELLRNLPEYYLLENYKLGNQQVDGILIPKSNVPYKLNIIVEIKNKILDSQKEIVNFYEKINKTIKKIYNN
ncbi:hypothetical protein LEP1GSC202_3659 [Leptospira yanagawae serovar Saopaulo str. Sao Paulo = ATCC 700523]|uniref:Uncharacterized protein n=1 Tax=Leptospira yanagawae serovar Saopaulo str. Sao Paulo = ATCC 700523 TaxID=1249483 RepID=A0A5E8H918_9LEPT|nr:hypothetical protein [Leptospira yanagawae]EOQ87218.1 hypothetical protein LEP1GSC202_3659 [Leptospira yanagawae serovar Saopaulo str. Sao Paulo = ATCC 700523]